MRICVRTLASIHFKIELDSMMRHHIILASSAAPSFSLVKSHFLKSLMGEFLGRYSLKVFQKFLMKMSWHTASRSQKYPV